MTREEIMQMDSESLETRRVELLEMIEQEGADLDAIQEETRAIQDRRAELEKEQREETRADMEAVASGAGDTIEKRGEKTMDLKEIRNSKAYIDAFAKYVKTGSDKECRAILTENAPEAGTSGPVPVPEFIEGRIQTAWEENALMQYVSRTYFRGNVKIGFERSATGAAIHEEGAAAPAEETLVLGIVELIPKSIKKWITISDEALDLNGQEFLDYIYDEIDYRVVKKAADEVVAAILAAPTTATDTAAAVADLTAAPAANTIINAAALLSGEAQNPIVVLNRQTYAAFKGITTADGYLLADPFDGMTPVFTDALPAYSAASAGDVYAIVGDFSAVRVNLPNGEEVTFKFDELSLAEKDLVKVVGRLYAGIGVIASGRFTRIKKG